MSTYDSFNRQKVTGYDVRVEVGGVVIEPGDLVVADRDGISVIPAQLETGIVTAAIDKAEREDGFRDGVRRGMPLLKAYKQFGVL